MDINLSAVTVKKIYGLGGGSVEFLATAFIIVYAIWDSVLCSFVKRNFFRGILTQYLLVHIPLQDVESDLKHQ